MGLELGFFSHVFYYVFIYEHEFWNLVILYYLCYKFWRAFFMNLNFPALGVLFNATFDIIYFFYYLFYVIFLRDVTGAMLSLSKLGPNLLSI